MELSQRLLQTALMDKRELVAMVAEAAVVLALVLMMHRIRYKVEREGLAEVAGAEEVDVVGDGTDDDRVEVRGRAGARRLMDGLQ